jgi:hypothetical protein
MRLLPAIALLALVSETAAGQDRDRFDHEQHNKLFPECQGCHAGITEPGRSRFPDAAICANCHDGSVERRVNWSGPPVRYSNLRFSHPVHARESGERLPADSTLTCSECHFPTGAGWLTVRRTISAQCLSCHGFRTAHTSAPDTACSTCHRPLAEAVDLPTARVAEFDKPASHDNPDFLTQSGHGKLADQGNQSCAVCHARDFCTQCHVNAPELRAIQALAPDRRSLALKAEIGAPASHGATGFQTRHGKSARRELSRCSFCHAQASCVNCHRTRPAFVAALPDSGPGRAQGAQTVAKRPDSHFADFADRHGASAGARSTTCSSCHARAECLECHRPATGNGEYHPPGFLTRHPTWAFQRQTECASCHNQNAFCVACHQQAGMTSSGSLRGGYHDANPAFLLNHGTAARQNIESCVTCHAERDCLACHSAQSGRRFNPHGPGFDAAALARRNPQTCSACHGRNIPAAPKRR